MTFYDISYLESQGGFNDIVKYTVFAILVIALIVLAILYARHRMQTKYRQLGIIVFLFIVLAFTGEYTNYQKSESENTQNQQMIGFIQKVAKDEKVSTDDVRVNSKYFNDNIIVKIQNKYYQVLLNSDRSAFQLVETHLISDPQIAQ